MSSVCAFDVILNHEGWISYLLEKALESNQFGSAGSEEHNVKANESFLSLKGERVVNVETRTNTS